MMFRYSFRWFLALIFAVSCIYSFACGRTGFGWFFLAMSGAFLVSALLSKRIRR